MEKISSLNLYPHPSISLLRDQTMKLKILKLTKFLIIQCIDTIESFFIRRTYLKFDAHIGDTLCQIRTYKLLLMAQYFNKNPEKEFYLKKLTELNIIRQKSEEKIAFFEDLINKKGSLKQEMLDKSETLEAFIKKHGLAFEITEDLFYLTQNLILTIYAKRIDFNVSIAIEYKKISKDIGTGMTTVEKLIQKAQRYVAEKSSEIIYSLLRDMPEEKKLEKILYNLEINDTHKRSMLPTYEVMKAIFLHMKLSKIPILLISHNIKAPINKSVKLFLYQFSQEKNEFELFDSSYFNSNLEIPCFVILVTTMRDDFIEQLKKIGLIPAILSNFATHPQNRLKNTPLLKEREAEIVTMEYLAKTKGFCQENPNLLFLKHAYAETLGNELLRIDQHKNIDHVTTIEAC